MARARPNYEAKLTACIKHAIDDSGYSKEEIGTLTGLTERTIYNKINKPHKITLEWLKMFIKATDMDPNYILIYLYEGKYKVQEKEN